MNKMNVLFIAVDDLRHCKASHQADQRVWISQGDDGDGV